MNLILDDGYTFGLGAFETIAIERGRPFLLDWHLERLEKALNFFQIQKNVTAEELFNFLEEQKSQNTNVLDHSALKVMVSPENILFTLRQNPYAPKDYEKGFSLVYSQVLRNETSPLTYHKTLNYGDCILEKRGAKAEGADEKIFLNTKGELCEGTTTNLFFVKDGQIFTPEESCGLLPGIMRRWVCAQNDIHFTRIRPDDVKTFDECFVTNSLMGIMPVMKLEDVEFSSRGMAERLRKQLLSFSS